MKYAVMLVTSSNLEEAKKIAYSLVENKLAACVNIIPQIISVYSWQEKINEDEEYLLVIKTRRPLFKAVKKKVLELHSYEVPEIIMLPVKEGHKPYLRWIQKETKGKK
ncbi:MAG: CutA1 divalent ion tolerance protein [Parcubacteria group bacterium GW2011_GWC2_42_6]|nr:MAG: CutA1 divalent ion tolerance protein [Parcubacteria group bacterium GW2011_GWC2_42_6]